MSPPEPAATTRLKLEPSSAVDGSVLTLASPPEPPPEGCTLSMTVALLDPSLTVIATGVVAPTKSAMQANVASPNSDSVRLAGQVAAAGEMELTLTVLLAAGRPDWMARTENVKFAPVATFWLLPVKIVTPSCKPGGMTATVNTTGLPRPLTVIATSVEASTDAAAVQLMVVRPLSAAGWQVARFGAMLTVSGNPPVRPAPSTCRLKSAPARMSCPSPEIFCSCGPWVPSTCSGSSATAENAISAAVTGAASPAVSVLTRTPPSPRLQTKRPSEEATCRPTWTSSAAEALAGRIWLGRSPG